MSCILKILSHWLTELRISELYLKDLSHLIVIQYFTQNCLIL